MEIVWNFIEKRSNAIAVKDQLHAIWYHSMTSLPDLLTNIFIGTAYPSMVLVPFFHQNLSSSPKGLERVGPKSTICSHQYTDN